MNIMLVRSIPTLSALAVVVVFLVPSRAQEIVTSGPPPEVRALVDAFMVAFNSGKAETWEAFAKERFTAELLKQRPAEERRKMYEQARTQLGTLTFERAMRRGPDAPLSLNVKGSTGAAATVGLETAAGTPLRISKLTLDVGGKPPEPIADGVPPPPVNGAMTAAALEAALDGYLGGLAAKDTFSGVVLVAKKHQPVFHKAYGLADRSRNIPNTTRTRFNIGSINKTFTQIAVGQLVAEGKLAHTDTLGKFFPDYPQAASRPATVQQLLNHTAGLADFFGAEFNRTAKDRFRSNADYFTFVGAQPPLFAPGARNQYCNGCYIALGAIIEKVSGTPYEQYVADLIFTRADMTSTGYPQTDAIEADIAIGYTRRSPDGRLRSNVLMHGASGSAAGGGYSTATDLLAFVRALTAGRFPGARGSLGIAGGAPGISAVVESEAEWTVIVLSNLDPPIGERLGVAIMERLSRQP